MGMPRTILISAIEKRDSARTPDTRISAHTMPRSVATTSAHTNTSTVTSAPFASSGRYSARSVRESTAGRLIDVCAYGVLRGIVVPEKTRTHLDFMRSQMDSRLRGNDDVSRRAGAGRGPIGVSTADSRTSGRPTIGSEEYWIRPSPG